MRRALDCETESLTPLILETTWGLTSTSIPPRGFEIFHAFKRSTRREAVGRRTTRGLTLLLRKYVAKRLAAENFHKRPSLAVVRVRERLSLFGRLEGH